MRLLNKHNVEDVLYPEEVTTGRDGNTRAQASKTGVSLKV